MSRTGFILIMSAVLFAMGIYAVVAFALDVYRYNTMVDAEVGNITMKLANAPSVVLQPGESLSFTFKETHAVFIKWDFPLHIEPLSVSMKSLGWPHPWRYNITKITVPPNTTVRIVNRNTEPVSLSVIAIPIGHIKPPDISFLFVAIILFIMIISICSYIDKKIYPD